MKILWYQYEDLLRKIIKKVQQFDFDHVVCIGRGGFLIGDAISRALDIPLAVVMAQSYFLRDQEQLKISDIAFINYLDGNILLVDDLVDTGNTLIDVKKVLYDYDSVGLVMTAVIWKKKNSKFVPDYFVEEIDSSVWIEQPFEIFDKGNL